MSEAQYISRPSTPMTTETVIHRPDLKMSELQEISPRPITPMSTETVIHTTPQAPKKPMAKILEFLKPTVYKPETDETPGAPKRILDALSRAGVRKFPMPKEKKPEVKTYPAPRKLTVHIVNGKTDAIIHQYVPTYLLMDISSKAREVLESKPWVGQYKIYGKYNPAAMSSMLDAMTHHLPIPISATNLVENLLIYEASLRLGIARTHTSLKPLLTSIYTQISSTPIDNEILAFVTYHLGSKEPVFMHMANVLCHQRFMKSVPNVQPFEKMVAKKPALQKAMVQIDRAHKARREAFKANKRARSNNEASEGDEKSDDDGDKVVGAQTVEGMLEAAASEVKNDQEQKEKLLGLFKNQGYG